MFMNCKNCNQTLENGATICPICGTPVTEVNNSILNEIPKPVNDQNNLAAPYDNPADIFGFDQQPADLKVETAPSESLPIKDMFTENINEQIIANPLPNSENINISAEPIPNTVDAPLAAPIVNNFEPTPNVFDKEADQLVDSFSLDLPSPTMDQNASSPDSNLNNLNDNKVDELKIEETPQKNNDSKLNSEQIFMPNINAVLENQVNDKQPKTKEKKPKRISILLCIIIILLMAGAGIGGYYVFLEFGPRQIAQVNKYEYKINRQYKASVNNNFLIIDNKEKTWTIEITSTIDFKSLGEFTTKTTEVYQEVKATNNKYNDIQMVVIEVRDNGKVFYAIAAEKSAGEFLSAQISFKDNKLNTEAIDVFAEVAKTAKKISQ